MNMCKKLIALLLASAIFVPAGGFCSSIETELVSVSGVSQSARKIKVKIVNLKKNNRTRSVVEPVTAVYYQDTGQLELTFNQNVGEVEIIVSGPSGVNSLICDTSDTWYAVIPVGTAPGLYELDILGPDYEGTGSFVL